MCVGVWSQFELWGGSQDLSAIGSQARGLHLCAVGLWPCRLVGTLCFQMGDSIKSNHSLVPIPPPPLSVFTTSSPTQVMARPTILNNNWLIAQPAWLSPSMRPSPPWKLSPSCIHCRSTNGTVLFSSTSLCCHLGSVSEEGWIQIYIFSYHAVVMFNACVFIAFGVHIRERN